ncbi:hypothetical protein MNV49_007891 [Pseudohyphozyma bogoriensis]|nr:hypothetical protein MNV49_007891 [Pseudohyphozyma bogoriensis]
MAQQQGGQPQGGYPPAQPSYGDQYGAPQQQQYGGGGYGGAPPPPPPHSYPDQQQQYQQYPPQPSNGGGANSMQNFFAEVESIQNQIQQFRQSINHVSELHTRRLATTDDLQNSQSTAQLAQLTAETSALTNSIRNQIHRLNEQNKATPQGDAAGFNTRKAQIATLQNGFRKSLEEYNTVEKKSRDKYRQRMERQIRIVKPDATQEEIKAAFDDQQGGQQIFSQALIQSRQSGARAAFAEVQSRNQDLRKIEETITQLAQMMQDMATLVLEQDESVRVIETQAVQANTDVEQGLQQTQKAVKSARAARKKRWICFFIIVIILIIVAVVVAVEVTKNK